MRDVGEAVQVHLSNACHAEDSSWLYGIQSELATHFNITQQRIEVVQCSDAHTVVINVLQPDEQQATKSQVVAEQIAEQLSSNPALLPETFGVTGADHVHTGGGESGGEAADQVGLWIGLTVMVVCLAVTGTVGYYKRGDIHAFYRATRRRAWKRHNNEDDYDFEGHTYGDGDQGGMVVSKTETTYELEGTYEPSEEPAEPDRTIQQRYVPSTTEGEALHMGAIPASA